jgi:hypothetical protein
MPARSRATTEAFALGKKEEPETPPESERVTKLEKEGKVKVARVINPSHPDCQRCLKRKAGEQAKKKLSKTDQRIAEAVAKAKSDLLAELGHAPRSETCA